MRLLFFTLQKDPLFAIVIKSEAPKTEPTIRLGFGPTLPSFFLRSFASVFLPQGGESRSALLGRGDPPTRLGG